MAAPGTAPFRPAVPAGLPEQAAQAAHQENPAARLVTGFAGFGAGSVNLAISSSILEAGAAEPGKLIAAAAFGLWGSALLAGAVVFLAKDRAVGGRRARYALAAAAAVHLAAIIFPAFAPSGLGLTQLSALLLTLMIIASLAWLWRAGARGESQLPQPARESAGIRPGRLLLAAFAGAVLVAGITTPGLAASTAGQYAVPHGEHGNLAPGGHHQR